MATIAPNNQIRISLDAPPSILHCGISVHGRQPIEKYRQLGFWCVHLYRYAADLRVDGQWYQIRPGCASLVAPQAELEYRFSGKAVHAFAHFRLPPARRNRLSVPILQNLGERFEPAFGRMQQVVAAFAGRPRQADARLWDLLLDLASPPTPNTATPQHPALRRAVEYIELHLAEAIDIRALAQIAGVSHNHLIRLFRGAYRTTIVGYITHRRIDRASHLLTATTLSIKTIAHEVGIPDLQHFNKQIRKHRHMSPRRVREAAQM